MDHYTGSFIRARLSTKSRAKKAPLVLLLHFGWGNHFVWEALLRQGFFC